MRVHKVTIFVFDPEDRPKSEVRQEIETNRAFDMKVQEHDWRDGGPAYHMNPLCEPNDREPYARFLFRKVPVTVPSDDGRWMKCRAFSNLPSGAKVLTGDVSPMQIFRAGPNPMSQAGFKITYESTVPGFEGDPVTYEMVRDALVTSDSWRPSDEPDHG